MISLFKAAKQDKQIGVDFLPAGVAVVGVRSGKKNPGQILTSEYLPSVGQPAQVEALQQWVRDNHLQKSPCVCLVAIEDCDTHQVEKPDVDESEMNQALTWRIKDLIDYDVGSAVVDSYPMPVSNKNNTPQVIVVSAHESAIGSYVDSVKTTGLSLEAIDIHDLVGKNLSFIQQGAGQTQAILTLAENSGLLSIFHDTDLYVSRDFRIGIKQIEQVDSEDQSAYDSLLLEIQRSMDYFESFYDHGSVSSMQVYPRLPATEKMVMYLQNASSFEIDFVRFGEPQSAENPPVLEPHCFHAYCAALRGLDR
jgi:MSHA biogenesis protein MshI